MVQGDKWMTCASHVFILLTLPRRAKTYRVEAVVDLPAPLFLGSEFLGLLKPATIGGVAVHVVLPDFSESGTETVLHPRARMDWVGSFAEKKREDNPRWPFGEVYGWGDERELSATRLLVIPKGRLTLREARSLHSAAEDWVQVLGIWIEVVARTDLRQERIKEDKSGHHAYVWVDRGKALGELLKGKHLITLNLDGLLLAISPWQWGKILAKTSEDARPPEAHVFLRDARHAIHTGHHRRSVLDSATATELSLAKLRDDYLLAEGNSRLAAFVGRRARHIDGIAKFLRDMGLELPGRIKEEISDPRNVAIHAGQELDEMTAGAALEKAEEVVDLAFQWKKLL
jgi:hypothetical protein